MQLAINQAKNALGIGEIPVGAIGVKNSDIIIYSHNVGEIHAEMICLNVQENIDELYITLEPCPMCLFRALEKKVKKIYFGAFNDNFGACGGKFFLKHQISGYYPTEIFGGIKESECSILLKQYFKTKR